MHSLSLPFFWRWVVYTLSIHFLPVIYVMIPKENIYHKENESSTKSNEHNESSVYFLFFSKKKEGKRNVFRFTSWNVTYNIYLRRTLWIWSDFMINSMNYIDCFQWIHCMLKSLTFLHVRRTFIRLLEWNLMNSCANILTWNYLSKCIHSR